MALGLTFVDAIFSYPRSMVPKDQAWVKFPAGLRIKIRFKLYRHLVILLRDD